MLSPVVRALVFGRHADRDDVAAVAEQALAADPANVAAFRTSIAEHGRRRALEVLRGTPAVVLVGERDRLCPVRHARAIAAELPEAELALYPGAGHMITFERAPEVAAHLRGLLAAASPLGVSRPGRTEGVADVPA
jgi:pimeloyl-ACP methyl ester carboxylesterase